MRSLQLVDVLKGVVSSDLQSQNPIINFYLTNNYSGGWEAWLQTIYAKGVFNQSGRSVNSLRDFNREVAYPGMGQKCDLWFQGGTGIWIELKTQRNASYTNTVGDFEADIKKIGELPRDFRANNVIVAIAIFCVSSANVTKLKQLKSKILNNHILNGHLSCQVYTRHRKLWLDVTDELDSLRSPSLRDEILLASFSPR